MNTAVRVADAVATVLNAGLFAPSFTAERAYRPVFDLAQLSDLQVTVVPKAMTAVGAGRRDAFVDCSIDIGIQQRVDMQESIDVIDGLMKLVEAIQDHLRLKRLDGLADAMWIGSEIEPLVAAEHLDQHHVLTSVLTVQYRVRR